MSNEDPRLQLYYFLELIEDYITSGIKHSHKTPVLKAEKNLIAKNNQQTIKVSKDQSNFFFESQKIFPTKSISLPELATIHSKTQGDSLDKIGKDALLCQACRLFNYRKTAIAHTGSVDAKLIILTDAPSSTDDSAGALFSDETGELLEKMLAAIGLSKSSDVIIFPITKCCTPNREPAPDEELHCSKFILRQLQLIPIPLILTFGRVSAQCCTGKTQEPLASLRNTIHVVSIFTERRCVSTYHPRDVLADVALKRPVWEDLKLLKTLL